jgi:predicted nucleotide-binding protein
MIERFGTDADGRRRLLDRLGAQLCLAKEKEAVEAIANKVTLREYKNGEFILQQEAMDNSLVFILAGSTAVMIHGREMAKRAAGSHVGEMALIDPSARRSASVVATKDGTVTAEISEADFTTVAHAYPSLWRALAVELAQRLRDRGKDIRPRNEKPIVFVGSSREALEPARAIQVAFAHDNFTTKVWTDGVFNASKATLESLTDTIERSDFAVLVFNADDRVSSRGATMFAPRDNVIFELGLFMGALGRERTYVVKPRGVDLKLPSDLLGITTLEYAPGDDLAAALGAACTSLRRMITDLGSR